MEDKKNHPSLPSNYVTLAQLQERWLKQQQMNHDGNEDQPQQQDEQQEQKHPHRGQRGDEAVVVRTHGPASRSSAAGNHRAKRYRPKIRNDSGSDRRAIQAASENHRKSEANAGIGDEDANLDRKGNKSRRKKKKKSKRKPSVEKEERGASEEGAAATMEVNKETENSEAKKTTIKSELNEKKSGDLTVEVEQKLGALSVNSGNGKQNGRLRRVRDCVRHSQPQRNQRNYFYSGRDYGFGNGHVHVGGRRYEVEKRRGDKMVWVRKDDGNVGGIET